MGEYLKEITVIPMNDMESFIREKAKYYRREWSESGTVEYYMYHRPALMYIIAIMVDTIKLWCCTYENQDPESMVMKNSLLPYVPCTEEQFMHAYLQYLNLVE